MPPATPDIVPFAAPPTPEVAPVFAAEPLAGADDIYALPAPAEDLWEPLPEEAPAFEAPAMYVAATSQADTATRLVPLQSAAEPAPAGTPNKDPAEAGTPNVM